MYSVAGWGVICVLKCILYSMELDLKVFSKYWFIGLLMIDIDGIFDSRVLL